MKINFTGEGHPAFVLRALRNRKVRDGSGWGRAGTKKLHPGDLHMATLLGSAESVKEAKRRLIEVVAGSGNNSDWGRNWEIVSCFATEFNNSGPSRVSN
jgi:hypothetical protein